jgi:hypothetical protein
MLYLCLEVVFVHAHNALYQTCSSRTLAISLRSMTCKAFIADMGTVAGAGSKALGTLHLLVKS